ncbi:interferon gamma 1 [Embiotoca jacksoni]|uniref:interferon gamma 1 n=1 Tax=Embiotoca jacksoni TaxID=100190 RepID=UPI003703C674
MVGVLSAAVCLSLWLSVCQVGGSYIPQEMNKTIQNLLQHYKITNKEKFNGKPVFTMKSLTGKREMKMMVMSGILDSYEKLIGHMLKQLPTPSPQMTAGGSEAGGDIKTSLNYILNKIQLLKDNNYQEQNKVLLQLHAFKHIQMDNFVVQSKALWELPLMYEEASSLSNDATKRRRRRRQAKAKSHLRI